MGCVSGGKGGENVLWQPRGEKKRKMKGWNSTFVTNWQWRWEWMKDAEDNGARDKERLEMKKEGKYIGELENEWICKEQIWRWIDRLRDEGVSDRPSLCWALKTGAPRPLWYGWRTTFMLYHNTIRRAALCIHSVKTDGTAALLVPCPTRYS